MTFIGMIFISLTDPDVDEEWCGCDESGIAHIPGSKGFACAEVDAGKGEL